MLKREVECKVCRDIIPKNKALNIQYKIPTGYEYLGDKDEPEEDEEILVSEYVCCEKCLKTRMKDIYELYQTSITVKYPYHVISEM